MSEKIPNARVASELQPLIFGPFRLDLRDERLWRGDEAVPLSPKVYAVLCRLVSQAGQLVTKDALLEAVWPDSVVSESVLTVAMRTLRRALGDQARAPRYIETVHGRGYRFIAPVSAAMPTGQPPVSHTPLFVGRDAELAQLAQWWTIAHEGQRQIGCIVGEPGIGKTALVETCVAQIRATGEAWIGHGQCLDHYGAGEAYLPVLEALGRLGRGPDGAPLISVLQRHAPSWLAHLPSLLAREDQARLPHAGSGVTPDRMLRELAEAIEALTAARPLVLVLEDLHWSDHATLEWLAYMARRRDSARLLILGVYRPVDAITRAPALRAMVAELRHHPQYAELALNSLSAESTAAYLQQRCGEQPMPTALLQLVHQRTGGHPLFLVAMADELGRRGLLETAINAKEDLEVLTVLSDLMPTSLQQSIEQRLEQLSDEDQLLLEAASVAGNTFAVAAVASGLGQPAERLEAHYTTLSRQEQFIQSADVETWPDGTVTACYQFRHALYHEVIYTRVSAGRRVHLHRQIGACKEAGYGEQAQQIAAELAAHFARGRDVQRAITYLHYAGENALQRSAYQEASAHLTMALENLGALPETRERSQQELVTQMALGQAVSALQGQASPEAERVYNRARALCQEVGEPQQLFLALGGLLRVYNTRGAMQNVRELGDEFAKLAQRLRDPDLLVESHHILGLTLLHGGDLAAARSHLHQGLRLYEPQRHHAHVSLYSGHDPGVCCHMHTAKVLWLLGYPDQAVASSQAALTLAQQLAHPLSLSLALCWAAILRHLRREAPLALVRVEAAMTIASDQSLAQQHAEAAPLRGWALDIGGQEEGRAQIQQGLAAAQAIGAVGLRPYHLSLLAEASAKAGYIDEGLEALDEALATIANSRSCWWEAELHRLRGKLLLLHSAARPEEVASCFQRAMDVARRQQAKSLELRAAVSLARLWRQQSKEAAAYALLAPIYRWFAEGFDTADLMEAKTLLRELRS